LDESLLQATHSLPSDLSGRPAGLERVGHHQLVTVTFFAPDAEHPFAFRTVTLSVRVPREPALYRMLAVPPPLVMVPLVMDQV